MELLGQINDREIIYIKHDVSKQWFNDLPNKSWLLFAIIDHGEINILTEVNRRAIENNVVYVCSAGSKCEFFHDVFDEDLVVREVENEYLPQYCIMTTWHNKFDDGFWFAVNSAYGDDQNINKVVCLDITSLDMKPKIVDIVKKMQNGWIPEDE